jgi:diguanylate cyclase (GGDEF)-like protein/PAS domain S-box-containing protein
MGGFLYVVFSALLVTGTAFLVRRGTAARGANASPLQSIAQCLPGSNVVADEATWEWDMQTGQCTFSPRFREIIGFRDSPSLTRWSTFLALIYDQDRAALIQATRRETEIQAQVSVEIRVRTRGGGYRWFLISGGIHTDASGHALSLKGVLTDIHERKQLQIDLARERSRGSALMEAIDDAVLMVDASANLTFMSAGAESLTGFSLSESCGRSIHDVCHLMIESSGQTLTNYIAPALSEGLRGNRVEDLLLVTRDGLEIPVSQSVVPMLDQAGTVTGAVIIIRDLSRERNFISSLEVKDRQDASTRLVSRREFNRRIAFVLERTRATGRFHAVVHLRLEPFDEVLKKCGQAAADALLRQAGVLLRDNLREGDTLARLNGGEFGVLYENCPPEHAFRLASKALAALKEFVFSWHYRTYNIVAFVGLVNVAEDLYTLNEVIAAAELACAMAREKGRDGLHIYQPVDGELSHRQGDAEWVAKIHTAVEENRYRLFTQPIVPLDDLGADPEYREITVRLLDPQGRMVPASEFICAAERFGMGTQLDQWVVRTVFLTLAKRRQRPLPLETGRWAINLSATSVCDPKFPAFLQQQFIHYGIPHSLICFEITEKVIQASMGRTQDFIAEFRPRGCRFALDKFGAGVSLFSQLKALSVDYVKIDGAFIKGLSADPIDIAIVEATTRIAACMGIKVIAEFVETDAAITLLKQLGVKFAQGNALGTVQPFDAPVTRPPPPRLRAVPVNH